MSPLSSLPLQTSLPQYLQATIEQIFHCVEERKYCAILGPRFSGKTDLLNFVREELEHRSRVVVRVDLYDADATKPSDFFNSLATLISRQLANQTRISKTIAASVSDSSTFRSFIQDVIVHVNNEPILIVDHLEGVSNDLVRLLLTSLRAIYMEQQSNGEHRLVAIVVGAMSLAGIATGETSPFRGIAELVIVDLPPDEESERYITTFFSNLDIRLSSVVLKYLIRTARGDRYLIKILCDKCAQLISGKNPRQLSAPLVEKISQEFILNEAQSYAPLQEAVRLIENDPDLLVCTLLLTKKSKVNKQQLPLSLSPDIDPFYLTGVIRKVGPDSYQFLNEVYRQFLTAYFHPGRVGHLLSMSGRWDQAIDYLETSIAKGDIQYRTDLLAATISSIYASSDINHGAEYLTRGLVAGFNITEGRIWSSSQKRDVLNLVGIFGDAKKGQLAIGLEMPISDDRLEARSYRDVHVLRGNERNRNLEWAFPLLASERQPIGVVYIVMQEPKWAVNAQREWELELTGYLQQAARAISSVTSRREAEQRRQELAETLREVAVLINGSLDLGEVLSQILKQMNRVLPFDMASVQLLNTASNTLDIIASQGFDDPKSVENLSFPLDDTFPDSRVWHKKLPIRYADVREYFPHFTDPKYHATRIRSWLGVPLLIGESAIGVITLDSFKTNSYTLEHEHLAMAFAGQAAVAIENARLFEQTRQRGEQLAVMDQIVLHIAMRLETKELLRDVVRRATELIKGSGGEVYLWDETDQSFRLESVYGLNSSLEGSQIEKEQGVIREVLRYKKPYAVTDYSNWSKRPSIFDQDNLLTAVVGAPIILGDRFLGVIAVHDTVQGRVFGEAEKDLLHCFGNHVAVALENARAYKAEQETKDYQERLISSSLDGIIAVDDHGWINVYNEGAERICGFSPEEVLNREKQVGDLYGDQGTAKYIKQTLSAEGKLENYETSMKNNNGEMIPILLSAAVLKDSKGNPIGSIGYFKDLRPLRKVEGELKSALDAISTVAKASDLDNGLAALAEKMVMGLNVSFCLMFFLDEEKQVLKVRAAYPVQRSDPLIWDPSVGNTLDLKGLPISEWLAKMESPRAFRKGENTNDENIIVDFIQETTALGNELQSALVIPFRTEQGLFGVCVLGETRNWERNPFDENKKKSAISMTDAVTVLIDRLRAQETMRRRMVLAEELRKVSDAVAHLTTEAPKAVLDQIAQSICKMVDADCVMIYPYYEDLGIYDVRNIGTYGLRDEGKRFKPKPRMRSKSMARIVLQNNMPVVVDDIDTGRDRSSHVAIWVEENEFIKRERIKSFVGIGLWGGQEVIGVLFVNFRTHHRLTDDELNTIRIFANQAAVVIQQSRLYQRGEKDHKIVLSTNKINQLIGSAEALHEVWQAILEGAMDVTSANRGRILSMDRSGNLIPEITLGFDEKSNARFQDRLYEPCPLVRGVMDNKEPLLISDMADDSHPKSLREYCTKFCPDVKSILAAPVLHNDTQTVLGILVLESADWAAFSAYDKILMAAFVKYAGIAVQSAERIAAIQQGAELRSELLKTGQGITSLEKSQEVLQSIADGAKTALGCDLVTLYTYDESREEIGYPPTISGKLMHHPALQMLGYVSKQSVVWKILQTGKPHFAEDSLHDDLVLSDASARRKDFHSFVEREEICSSAGIPLLVGDKKVGILFVNYRIPHPFPEDEQKNTLLFATQAAIAIHNARLYEDIQKHEKQLGALYDAAKVITQSAGLDRKQLLDKILELAIFITSTRGEKAALGTIQIIDEQTNAREFTNVYPPSEYSKLRVKLGHRLSLDKTKTKDGRIGIPGRAAVTMKPQLVSNIKNDPDYIEYSPDTKSELAVPLLDGDRTIGIFSVESDMISAFDASDQEALEALAELAVIAIKNAEQYEVLRKTQDELLAAGTIAWMGLFGSDWSHTVAQKTYSIRTYANTIKDMLQTGDSATKQALEQIDRIAQEIQDVPLVLSSPAQIEQGSPLLIDSFILDETKRLIQSHSQIQQKFGLGCNKITVRADKTLLKMALQKLVENAVRNMSDHGILIVESQVVDKGTVSVTIQDTGHGMPEEVKLIYGLKRIPKGPGERGSGMGALLARFILRKYGGDLRLIWSEKDRGTKVEVTLPICVQLDRVERKDL